MHFLLVTGSWRTGMVHSGMDSEGTRGRKEGSKESKEGRKPATAMAEVPVNKVMRVYDLVASFADQDWVYSTHSRTTFRDYVSHNDSSLA